MKTDSRLRASRRQRWANAQRRVLVASTDGFQPYSRLTGTGMKQLHAWVCNPIAGGGCTVPCQSLKQEMAPKATKQVRCTVLHDEKVSSIPISPYSWRPAAEQAPGTGQTNSAPRQQTWWFSRLLGQYRLVVSSMQQHLGDWTCSKVLYNAAAI